VRACTLLSRQEAAELLAGPATDGRAEGIGCSWQLQGSPTQLVLIELRPAGQYPAAEKIARHMEREHFEDLPGIGDRGFYGQLIGHTFAVTKQDQYVQLTTVGFRDDASRRRARSAITAILSRL
jgi:hypothetical protein